MCSKQSLLLNLKVFKQGSLYRTSQHFQFANMYCKSLKEGVDGAFSNYLTTRFSFFQGNLTSCGCFMKYTVENIVLIYWYHTTPETKIR